jgi:hypothetical protein
VRVDEPRRQKATTKVQLAARTRTHGNRGDPGSSKCDVAFLDFRREDVHDPGVPQYEVSRAVAPGDGKQIASVHASKIAARPPSSKWRNRRC